MEDMNELKVMVGNEQMATDHEPLRSYIYDFENAKFKT